jgi:Xaa-Pro aminopeptidase
MKYLPIDPNLFIENRKRFVKHMKPNTIAVFCSNDDYPRNGDQFFQFRQNSDIFYLSGLDQAKTIIVLYPDCKREELREIVFTEETSDLIAIWYGKKYSKEEATKASGIQNVQWLSELNKFLVDLMANCDGIYLNSNENIRFATDVQYTDMRFINEMRAKFPLHEYYRAAPIMRALRTIKSKVEVDLIRTACNITGSAFERVLRYTKPGVMEYEIEAEIIHEFTRNRANGHAYYPIIASGASACVLHYVENNKECKDGDLLLLDFGAEYANYAGDLSRTVPVNGKFSARQKDCYSAVLRVMKQATSLLVVGTTIDEYHKKVCKLMEEELIGLGLFTAEDVKNQDPKNPLFFKYYMHGTSHFMGLDVHDVGFKQEPLQAGMLFSCEPGLYILDEGIGIRIENDILVSEDGPVDLMANIPREVDEIEAIMNS